MKKIALLAATLGTLAAMSASAGTLYTKPAVRDAWADAAAAGDITDPGNAFVSAGWLSSSTPPARQYFNWVLNYNGNGVRYLMQNGVSSWDTLETYPIYGLTRDSSGILYESLATSNIGETPATATTWWGPILTETATAGDNTNKAATTAFVHAAVSGFAPLASPTFTGTPAAPTPAAGTNTTQLATTAFVHNVTASYALLASPTFTGVPAAPTATLGTNTTQLATTAFVQNTVTGGALGFVPVQQGGGTGQGTNKIYIGWLTSSQLGLQIDTTNYSFNWPINITGNAATATTATTATSATSATNASNVPWSGVSSKPTTVAGYGITDFSSSQATNGYQRIAGGLIIEWGTGPFTGVSPQSVTFPLACPTAVFSVTVTPIVSSGAESFSINGTPTLTGFSLNSGSGDAFYWQMICH